MWGSMQGLSVQRGGECTSIRNSVGAIAHEKEACVEDDTSEGGWLSTGRLWVSQCLEPKKLSVEPQESLKSLCNS